MIVTVQDEIGAVRREHLAKFRAVDQSPQMPAGRALRRMMNEHHAEQSACLLERLREARKLRLADESGRHERSGRHPEDNAISATPSRRRTNGKVPLGAPSSPRM